MEEYGLTVSQSKGNLNGCREQVTEKTGCTKNNVAQAAANFALVNKKYRIIPEDIKLSKALDIELLAEWDRYRKWFLRAAGRKV